MSSRAAKKKTLLLLIMMMEDEELPISYERKTWARQWLLRREQRGAFHTLFQELAVEDTPGFSEYMRMPYSKFVALAELIGPYIKKKDTVMRMSIPPSEKLALAIRFLATGESFQSLWVALSRKCVKLFLTSLVKIFYKHQTKQINGMRLQKCSTHHETYRTTLEP